MEATSPAPCRCREASLEIQAEQKLPDRNARIVAYCAGGTRSALAAATLQELGYAHVETANPGFVRWKDLGYPVETPPNLTDSQRERYSRHILLPEVGEVGQAKLLQSKVSCSAPVASARRLLMYLAAAGVGTLGIVDADVVDASNLQRQIIHATSRVGTPKVESAAKSIAELNTDVKVVPYRERLTSANAERLFGDYEVIVDGTDNFPTRYLVNDASVWSGQARRARAASSASTVRSRRSFRRRPRRSSGCRRARATAAFTPSRRRRTWRRAARRPVCWGFSAESSAPFRPRRPSRSCWARARRWPDAY